MLEEKVVKAVEVTWNGNLGHDKISVSSRGPRVDYSPGKRCETVTMLVRVRTLTCLCNSLMQNPSKFG